MLALIKLLIFGYWPCKHEWETIKTGRYTGDFNSGTYYDLRCKKCGDVKARLL